MFALVGFVLSANAASAQIEDKTRSDAGTINSRKTLPEYIEDANRLSDRLLHSPDTLTRRVANDSLHITFSEALALEEAKGYKFEQTQFQGISVVASPDNAVTFFTWQYFVNDSTYLYGGYLHTKEGKTFALTDKAREHRNAFQLRLRESNWYGALYYRIIPFEANQKTMYLLFGYNAHSFFARRKLLDVLYFENDKPRFGYPAIEMKSNKGQLQTVQRFVMEYSASVSVILNYSDLQKMIIFDHLIYGAPVEGGGSTNIPDGSYCGLKLEKGKWTLIDKVHKDEYINFGLATTDKAILPAPILGGSNDKSISIFGRKRQKAAFDAQMEKERAAEREEVTKTDEELKKNISEEEAARIGKENSKDSNKNPNSKRKLPTQKKKKKKKNSAF